MDRSKREWALTVAVLVVVPVVVLGGLVVGGLRLIGGVNGVSPLSCPKSAWDFAATIATDPAADDLASEFPDGPAPNQGCDEDDRTVSVDIERQTGLSRDDALRVGRQVLERNGWRDLNPCYSKRIDGRRVWAMLTYRDEDRESDLRVSMVSVRSYACPD